MSDIELIKNRIKISDLVGKYVALKPKSNGEYVGLCPFHGEKTPSFTVSENKGFFHCFGCGENGDIFTFLMKIERMEYIDALKTLAQSAGVVLKQQSKQKLDRIKLTHKIYQEAQNFYHNQLAAKSRDANHAFQYLKSRGFTNDTIQKYGLGFAPDYNALPKSLSNKFSEEELLDSKIIYKKNSLFDIFAGRVIFPIHDRKGAVIAFGGRILTAGKDQPKYLNSPENPIFHKSFHLYGLYQAAQSIIKQETAVIVEGYVDVLTLHQSGIKNAVAPLGTSLKLEHLHILSKMCKSVVVCLDGDAAGNKAMMRTIDLILPEATPEFQLKFVSLPSGQDPDDFIKNHGREMLLERFKKAKSMPDFLFDNMKREYDIDTPEGKAAFKSVLVEQADRVKHQYLKQEYKHYLLDKFWKNIKKHGKKVVKIQSLKPLQQTKKLSPFEELLALIIAKPELLKRDEVFRLLIDAEISDKMVDNIRCILLEWKDSEHENLYSAKALKEHFIDRSLDLGFLSFFVDRFSSLTLDPNRLSDKIMHKYQLNVVLSEIEMLKKKLKDVSNDDDLERYDSLIGLRNKLKSMDV